MYVLIASVPVGSSSQERTGLSNSFVFIPAPSDPQCTSPNWQHLVPTQHQEEEEDVWKMWVQCEGVCAGECAGECGSVWKGKWGGR